MARKVVKEITREEAFTLADEVAREIVGLRSLINERDAAIQAVQDNFNPQIDIAETAVNAKIALIGAWAKSHRSEYFADKKSHETPLAIMSFRYGNPTLRTLSSKDTWEDVVEALKADAEGADYVKTKEEPDKRGLLKKDAEFLARFRLRITQSETFAVDPKTDVVA